MAEPVAWRVKDFADGWIYYTDEERARLEAEVMSSALVEPVFASPQSSSQVTEEMVERALTAKQSAFYGVPSGRFPNDRDRKEMRAALTAALFPVKGDGQ